MSIDRIIALYVPKNDDISGADLFLCRYPIAYNFAEIGSEIARSVKPFNVNPLKFATGLLLKTFEWALVQDKSTLKKSSATGYFSTLHTVWTRTDLSPEPALQTLLHLTTLFDEMQVASHPAEQPYIPTNN